MKQIFLQQGREKFLKSGARGITTWKQQNDVERNNWAGVSPGMQNILNGLLQCQTFYFIRTLNSS